MATKRKWVIKKANVNLFDGKRKANVHTNTKLAFFQKNTNPPLIYLLSQARGETSNKPFYCYLFTEKTKPNIWKEFWEWSRHET